METVEIVETETGQVAHLPADFRFEGSTVSIRREGEAAILEPSRPRGWPVGFFEAIRIDDSVILRPDQGAASVPRPAP